jgi:hypothetical protein
MVWTSYLPLPLQLKEESSAETKSRGAGVVDEIESNVFPETISLPGGQLEMSDMEGFSGAAPGLEEGMPAQESEALNTQNVISSWVANSLLYYAQKAPGKMDLTDIAKRLQVTPHVVKKTADFLIQNEDQIGTVLENETDLNAADIRDVFTRSNIDKLKSIF